MPARTGCCSSVCGFTVASQSWTNTTLQGDLAFSGPGYLTGSGIAVLTGESRLNTLGAMFWRWTLTGPTQVAADMPTSGRFWMGIPGGLGIAYNYGDEQLQEVTLASDGSISTVDHVKSYPKTEFAGIYPDETPGRPVVTLCWESFTSGSRYVVGNSDRTFVVRAHVPATMTTTTHPIVVGAEFSPAPVSIGSLRPIDAAVACSSAIHDCVMCADMPTPGVATVTATWALTLIPSDRGDPSFTRLSSVLSAFSDELRAWDRIVGADGIYWVAECRWIEADNPDLGIAFTPGTVLQTGWDTAEAVGASMARDLLTITPTIDKPVGYDATAVQLLLEYDFNYEPAGAGVGDSRGARHFALYQCTTFSCLTANTFTLLDEVFELSWTNGPGSGTEYSAWITDWPATVSVEFN